MPVFLVRGGLGDVCVVLWSFGIVLWLYCGDGGVGGWIVSEVW